MAFSLISLTFLGLLFEIFGLALVLPVISLLIDDSYSSSNFLLNEMNNFFVNVGLINSPKFLLILIISIYCLKSIIQVLITYQQKRIVTTLTKNLSNKLYHSYINQNYLYFTNNNKSKMIQLLQVEMVHFFNFFESLMGLIAELIILVGIYIVVLLLEPRGILILTFAYLISGIVYYKLLNQRIKKWGQIRLTIDQTLSKLILETFNVIKEIILNNKYLSFINYFNSENHTKSKYAAFQLTANQLPRIYFELVALISIISFIFLLIYLNTDSNTIIFILAILGAASFKLLPSINKIITYYQGVSYYSSSFYKIYDEIKDLNYIKSKEEKEKVLRFKNEIHLKDLSYSYSKNNLILNNVDFKIKKGSFIGISGKSGTGKTTFINLLTGLIEPNSGNVLFDGLRVKENLTNYQSMIGYVSQNVFLMDESIKKNVAFELDAKLIDEEKVKQSLQSVDLWEWVESQEERLDTSVGEGGIKISGGQKHRIGIASALYKDPDILIFDEPTTALDKATETEVMNAILNLSFTDEKTIIIVSHDLNILKRCKEIFEIKNNNIYKIN